MKRFLRHLLLPSLLLGLFTPATIRADENLPMFGGSSLTINGVSYDWNSAVEDAYNHTDYYLNSSGFSLLVTGRNSTPSLATVSGGAGVSGYLSSGVYGDLVQTSSNGISLTINGRSYSTVDTTTVYTVDLGTAVLSSTSTFVYSGSGGSFTAAAGVITGSESGFEKSGILYVNNSGSEASGYTSPNGHVYDTRDWTTTYALDGNGQVVPTTTETYTGSYGSFTVAANGDVSGVESGYKSGSTFYLNATYPVNSTGPGSGSYDIFGVTYAFDSGTAYTNYDSNRQQTSGWASLFNSSTDSGWMNITYTSATGVYVVNGWDQYIGSFHYTGTSLNFAWDSRTGQSFYPAQLWVNTTLVNWQSGALNSDGSISDTYASTGGGVTLNITGQMRGYQTTAQNAAVLINGTNVGTLSLAAGFAVTGWTIQTTNPITTYSTPLFTSAMTLWVNGTEYPFAAGYGDTAGHRTDTYSNSSTGTLTISGMAATPNSGEVTVSYFNMTNTGSYSDTGYTPFSVNGVVIQTSPPPPPDPIPDPVYGPRAFWVRGRFYSRTAIDINSYTSPTGYSLSLVGNSSVSTTLTGSGPGGSFGGTINADSSGLSVVYSSNGTPVAIWPANEDGSLRLSGEVPPANLPPALMVTGMGIWQFLGATDEDSHPGIQAAYYGNAFAANNTAAIVGGGRLIKIRLDGTGTVTLTNYLAGTSAYGTYSTQTHLFQTGVTASLPMPINGVLGSDQNNQLWELPQAPDGSPATFLVHGDVWRFTIMVEGVAQYQGYYDGQSLTLGTDDGFGRLVTVHETGMADVIGTLNGVRASVRMRDGSMIYSGNFDGTRINPILNANNLYTIAADLDITGNVISFGALNGDAAAVGMTMQFGDANDVASLGFALGRPAADWTWYHAGATPTSASVRMMNLNSSHTFNLFVPGDPINPAVVLAPQPDVVSKIPKLELTNPPAASSATSASVLTKGMADGRYLQLGTTQALVLNSGINVTNGGGAANTVASNGSAIGQNLQVGNGQVVIGKNNTANATDIFVVGAGTSTTSTNNALSVSTAGDTSMTGNLTVSGNSTISGSATVQQNLQVTGNGSVHGVLRVRAGGDIGMGIFTTSPAGMSAP